jgi:long-subunit fatty acid transport protein
LVAGASSTAINAGFNTSVAGARNGTATLGFTSTEVGGSGLGTIGAGSQVVSLTGGVYRLAEATLGSLTFGNVLVGSNQTRYLSVSNSALADMFSEGLNASLGSFSGASAGILNLRVHGKREVFPIINGMDVSMITGTRPELELDGSGWAPTWMIGAFGQPHERVTWGATITGRVDAEMSGPISVTYSDDSPQPGDTLQGTQTTTQMLPWAFMAGANFDLSPNVELGTEFRYWLYRQYERQHTDVVGIFLVRELETMKNYNDSWAASAGVRVHDLAFSPRLELMAGAQYDKSPAPKQTVTLDQPSFSHPAAHLGARFSTGRYRFGASYIHYWYLVPTIVDSVTAPPSNIRGHGSNNIFTVSIEASL